MSAQYIMSSRQNPGGGVDIDEIELMRKTGMTDAQIFDVLAKRARNPLLTVSPPKSRFPVGKKSVDTFTYPRTNPNPPIKPYDPKFYERSRKAEARNQAQLAYERNDGTGDYLTEEDFVPFMSEEELSGMAERRNEELRRLAESAGVAFNPDVPIESVALRQPKFEPKLTKVQAYRKALREFENKKLEEVKKMMDDDDEKDGDLEFDDAVAFVEKRRGKFMSQDEWLKTEGRAFAPSTKIGRGYCVHPRFDSHAYYMETRGSGRAGFDRPLLGSTRPW